jgi:hypothetical protein
MNAYNKPMEQHLRVAEAITELLENRFSVLGYRFGLDPLLGFIPWLGDIVSLILSLYLIWIGIRMRLPEEKIQLMLRNLLFDFILGVIPFVGDIGDFFFKANSKNLHILKAHAPQVVEARIIPAR